MTYLLHNRTAYYEHFAWQKNGLSASFKHKLNACLFTNGDCRLCAYLRSVARARQLVLRAAGTQNGAQNAGDEIERITYTDALKRSHWAHVDEHRLATYRERAATARRSSSAGTSNENTRLITPVAEHYALPKALLLDTSASFVEVVTQDRLGLFQFAAGSFTAMLWVHPFGEEPPQGILMQRGNEKSGWL